MLSRIEIIQLCIVFIISHDYIYRAVSCKCRHRTSAADHIKNFIKSAALKVQHIIALSQSLLELVRIYFSRKEAFRNIFICKLIFCCSIPAFENITPFTINCRFHIFIRKSYGLCRIRKHRIKLSLAVYIVKLTGRIRKSSRIHCGIYIPGSYLCI